MVGITTTQKPKKTNRDGWHHPAHALVTSPVHSPHCRPLCPLTPCTLTRVIEPSGVAYILELLSPLSMPHDCHCQCHTTCPVCSPTLLTNEAILLPLLTSVHDGLQLPSHSLSHSPVCSPCGLPHIVLFAPSNVTRLAPCATWPCTAR